MENLFIIGNGFDLAHGLKTSLNDFKTFLYKNYDLSTVSFKNVEPLYDFEFPETTLDGSGAEVVQFERYAKPYFKICNQLNEKSGTWKTDWTCFEQNLANITKIVVDKTNIDTNDNSFDYDRTLEMRSYQNEIFNQSYQKFTEYFFKQWMESILDSVSYKRLGQDKKQLLKELVLAKKLESYFFTFNYTRVLEEVYEIDEEIICHIHGEFGEGHLVVGHGDDSLPSYHDNPFAFDFTEAKRQSRKPVKKIIEQHEDFFNLLSSVKNIYIIGSSILDDNPIDLPYLEKILSSVSAQVTVYLDSYEMTAVKKTTIETCLKSLSSKVKAVEVIDSRRNKVLNKLPYD